MMGSNARKAQVNAVADKVLGIVKSAGTLVVATFAVACLALAVACGALAVALKSRPA